MKIEGKLPPEPYFKRKVGSHPEMPPFLLFQDKPIARITDAVVEEDGSIRYTAEVDDPDIWRKLFAPAMLPSGVVSLPTDDLHGCCTLPAEAKARFNAWVAWVMGLGGGLVWGYMLWGVLWRK